jgi:LCP family protein required for cell wall assembly
MSEPPQGSGRGNRGGSEEPEFDWLYGKGRSGGGPRDPEPTRMIPTMKRPGAEDPGRSGGPRETRAPRGESEPPRRLAPTPPNGPGGPERPTRPPRERRPRRIRWGWVKAALALWLVFLLAVPLFAWSQVDRVAFEPDGDRPAEQGGTTYLLVGSDSREGLSREEQLEFGTGRGEGQRTDTIMLLHTGSGPNLLMSLPRDSNVEVPGYGTQKINAAFAYGGPELLVETIELNTGIRIDDYVEIGFGGFVSVVDAVGGVEICPRRAMRDPQANLDVERGCQEADGITALGYARSRKLAALGDIDRARRQREVVSAVGREAASPGTVLNPVRYYRTATSGVRSLRVGEDTSLFSATRFAWGMTRVTGDNGLTCSVPIVDLAVTWDPERAPRLFELIAEDRTADVPRRLCRANGLAN